MVDGERRERILIEVGLGLKGPAREPADERAFRQQMEREVAEIAEQGYGLDIPPEIP